MSVEDHPCALLHNIAAVAIAGANVGSPLRVHQPFAWTSTVFLMRAWLFEGPSTAEDATCDDEWRKSACSLSSAIQRSNPALIDREAMEEIQECIDEYAGKPLHVCWPLCVALYQLPTNSEQFCIEFFEANTSLKDALCGFRYMTNGKYFDDLLSPTTTPSLKPVLWLRFLVEHEEPKLANRLLKARGDNVGLDVQATVAFATNERQRALELSRQHVAQVKEASGDDRYTVACAQIDHLAICDSCEEWPEARDVMEEVYKFYASALPPFHPTLISMRRNLAVLLERNCRDREALVLYEENLKLAKLQGDPIILADAMATISVTQEHVGEYEQSLANAQQAVDICRPLWLKNGDVRAKQFLIRALSSVGFAQMIAGRLLDSQRSFEESLQFTAADDPSMKAQTNCNLAEVHFLAKNYSLAVHHALVGSDTKNLRRELRRFTEDGPLWFRDSNSIVAMVKDPDRVATVVEAAKSIEMIEREAILDCLRSLLHTVAVTDTQCGGKVRVTKGVYDALAACLEEKGGTNGAFAMKITKEALECLETI